jgi:predicted ATPase
LITYCVERKALTTGYYYAALFHACSRAMAEPTIDKIEKVRAAMEALLKSGSSAGVSMCMCRLAELLLMTRDVTGAEGELQKARGYIEQSGECMWLAELYRLDGLIALKRAERDYTRAEACFLEAIEIARGQGARMLELRAATELARLWRDTGSPNDPRALLEPILAAIEGGENTRDVRNARAVLAEIE